MTSNVFEKNAPTRDRTEDLSVNSRTLYQLSHGGEVIWKVFQPISTLKFF
jgi:hypothetical protein